MIDVKKLIAGFLVLAAITSASAFVLLSFTSKQGIAEPSPASAENAVAKVPQNAFVEPLPQAALLGSNSPPVIAPSKQIGQSAKSDNMTANFTSVLSGEIVNSNPNGPGVDENGGSVLNMPAESAINQMLVKTVANAKLDITQAPSQNTRILENYSKEDVSLYIASVNKILSRIADNTKLADPGTLLAGPETMSAVQLSFGDALRDITQLQVPRPLTAVNKSLLEFLANQKKFAEVAATNYQTDPLKALIAVQNADRALSANSQKFQSELQKFGSSGAASFLREDGAWLSLWDHTFGVPRAHAFFVIDLGAIAALIERNLKDLWKWIYTTLLRILVNQLVNQLQSSIVGWINGGGKGGPLFITNWQSFLANTYNQVAGAAISQVVPGLCRSFGPLISIQLRNTFLNDNLGLGCTLDQIVSNVKSFQNNFANGGWLAYSQTILPSGNYFGSLFETSQIVEAKARAAKDAAHSEGQSSNGFLSVKSCPHGFESIGGGQCFNNNTTEFGKEVNTTPGGAVAHSLFNSLDFKPNQIIKAERFEELLAAILDASVNRLITQGLKGMSAVFNGSSGSGSGNGPPGGLGLKPTITDLANSYRDQYRQILDSYTSWLNLEPQVVSTLNQVPAACSILASTVQSRVGELAALLPAVQTNIANAQAAITRLDGILSQISAATSDDALKAIFNTLQTQFDVDAINAESSLAQTRLGNLQTLQQNTQETLSPTSGMQKCSTPLDPPQI